ncbi:MAG: acyl--CoA ligase, partial [Fimbriimonadaceae bacterium]|nr:acyl--CoA ligase [Alphaproteobacteria bacterium]
MDKSENIAMDATGNLTVPGLLSLQVKKNPDKEFIVFEDNDENISSITYLEFARRVNCLANHLTRAGVSKGDKIAVMLGNCPEFIVSWLAINQIGAVSVPVNVFYSADELAYLISNADCVGIILEPVFLKQFRATPAECQQLKACVLARSNSSEESFTLLSEIDANGDEADPGVHVTSDDPSQIIFTSGTTSRPKGVILDHRGSVNQGISTSMLLRMPSSERIGIVLPLFHVNGQFVGVIPALTVGGTIVLIETFSAQKYWSQVKKHDCSFISIVPMVLRTLLTQPPRDDDADHNISNCFYALPTSPEEWDSFEKRFGVTLIEGYGLTETYALCTANPIVYGETKRHCIGLPSIGREIRVVDDKMNNMPMGETGQIITRGGA